MESYRSRVEDLKVECNSLLDKGHFASVDIKQRQVKEHHIYVIGSSYIRNRIIICDRLWENRAQRGMHRRRKKINLVLKIVLNKPNEGNG